MSPRPDRNTRRRLLVADLVAAGVGAAALAAAGWMVRRGSARRADRSSLAWFRRRHSPLARALAAAGRTAGEGAVLLPASLVLAAAVARGSGRKAAAPIPLSILASTILQKSIKALFPRARPRRALREGRTESSFPSGHAAATMALGATSSYVLARERLAPWVACLPPATILVVLAAGGKLYAEHHWLSDVVGGLCAGVAAAGGATALYEAWRAREPAGRRAAIARSNRAARIAAVRRKARR